MAGESMRPLSDLVAQGWEIIEYATGHETHSGRAVEKFLLRRQRMHKLLIIHRKVLGGYSVKEIEL